MDFDKDSINRAFLAEISKKSAERDREMQNIDQSRRKAAECQAEIDRLQVMRESALGSMKLDLKDADLVASAVVRNSIPHHESRVLRLVDVFKGQENLAPQQVADLLVNSMKRDRGAGVHMEQGDYHILLVIRRIKTT